LWQDAGEMIQTLGSEILGRVISSEDDKRLIDEAVRKIRPLQSETTK
jgi:hypothetical protein